MKVEIPRDHFGRPLVIPPGGGKPKPYRRCTTFIDVLADRFGLEAWKQRQVAVGLSKRADLLLRVSSAAGDKKVLDQVCKDAMEAAGSSTAATIGTAIHALTEQLDRGEKPEFPEAWSKDIKAYREAIAGYQIRDIEVFVVNDELQVGGTFDRIFVEPVEELFAGERGLVADLKTGDISFDSSKIAMQLAVYANSHRYDPATGKRTPLNVSQEQGLVVHLPAGEGQCRIHEADLKAGWEGVMLAADVWKWRQRKNLLVKA